MKGAPSIIDGLNDVLTTELTAINQYFLHARMQRNWGYQSLAEYEWKESIRVMKAAERVVDRILFLEGLPNLQRYGKVNVGETVPEQLHLDHASALSAVRQLNDWVTKARAALDNGTEYLLVELLEKEEERVDWLESQLELIRQLGEPHYLSQQIRKDD